MASFYYTQPQSLYVYKSRDELFLCIRILDLGWFEAGQQSLKFLQFCIVPYF